jgi:hypothetical protein
MHVLTNSVHNTAEYLQKKMTICLFILSASWTFIAKKKKKNLKTLNN